MYYIYTTDMKFILTTNKFWIILTLSVTPFFGYTQKFQLESASSVKILGTSTLSDWEVAVESFDGYLELNKTLNKNFEPSFIKKAALNFDVQSMKSGRGETMDNKIYKALKKDEQPTITFKSSEFNSIENEKDESEYRIWIESKGKVKIAGVEKEVSIRMEGNTEGNNILNFKGKMLLKMTEFNIEPPSAMFGQIVTGDEITLSFELSFIKN